MLTFEFQSFVWSNSWQKCVEESKKSWSPQLKSVGGKEIGPQLLLTKAKAFSKLQGNCPLCRPLNVLQQKRSPEGKRVDFICSQAKHNQCRSDIHGKGESMRNPSHPFLPAWTTRIFIGVEGESWHVVCSIMPVHVKDGRAGLSTTAKDELNLYWPSPSTHHRDGENSIDKGKDKLHARHLNHLWPSP